MATLEIDRPVGHMRASSWGKSPVVDQKVLEGSSTAEGGCLESLEVAYATDAAMCFFC